MLQQSDFILSPALLAAPSLLLSTPPSISSPLLCLPSSFFLSLLPLLFFSPTHSTFHVNSHASLIKLHFSCSPLWYQVSRCMSLYHAPFSIVGCFPAQPHLLYHLTLSEKLNMGHGSCYAVPSCFFYSLTHNFPLLSHTLSFLIVFCVCVCVCVSG